MERMKLSELSKPQLKLIDDINGILKEQEKEPIEVFSTIEKEDRDKISKLITELMFKSYEAGYKAAKEE